MSLTILPPAPTTCRQQSAVPTLLTPSSATSSRPKLALNTTNLAPLIGKKSTSLRLETLSATSPTARNTFRNGQEQESSIKPRRPTLTPLATTTTQSSIDTSTPSQVELPDSADTTDASTTASSAVSTTSVSTVDSLPPYKLPFNVTSILSNSPIPRMSKRPLSISQSRPFFPAPKKVAFRAPLTEEIKTEKYVLRNSDIESEPSTPLEADNHQTEEVMGATVETATASSPASNKRMSPVDEDEDSDTCPATPVAGRRKRHRQWVWTLGPVESASQDEQPREVGLGEEKVEAS